MRPGPGLPHACAGAAVLAALLYAAWPAAAPERAIVADHDNYFAFVKATPFAPPAPSAPLAPPAPAAVAGARRDAVVPAAADAPASPTALAQMEAEVRTLRRQGADEQAVYRLRAQRANARVAAQLAEREQAEKAWQQRVQAYRAERARVAGRDDGMSGQRAATLAQLRAERFEQEELAHLEASDTPAVPVLKQD